MKLRSFACLKAVYGATASCALALGIGTGIARAASDNPPPRIVHADVAALDQILVYNRFGSFDPYGMIYALQRDLRATDDHGSGDQPTLGAAACQELDGTEAGTGALEPGAVTLKPCKRPRPLVLRANVGDLLDITFTNLLRDDKPDISDDFCDTPAGAHRFPEMRDERAAASDLCEEGHDGAEAADEAEQAGAKGADGAADAEVELSADWPETRNLSLSMPGLEAVPVIGRGGQTRIDPACVGMDAVEPGESFRCRFKVVAEGTHLFSNPASPAGGEGNGGSLTHGLFGAVIAEPRGSVAYRSQVSKAAFDSLWAKADASGGATIFPHQRSGNINYDRTTQASENRMTDTAGWNPCLTGKDAEMPVARILRDCGREEGGSPVHEIVHGDLNAVIVPPAPEVDDEMAVEGKTDRPFREFTVIFHDELKTYYTNNFKELGELGPLSGVRDGFGINYGASGVGSLMVANRKKIGPAGDCVECLYEEFFLESWANGDPALLETFPDDPSNVHHSYLNDRIVFRNFHAGPKETHVFHLHSHQWFAGNDWNRGAYLDSQTIGPQQGFSYWIYQGGLDRYRKDPSKPQGYWSSLGSGNRNRTPGDAIFHCHLYPHFAQGMWELWRVHDVLEDGTRTLPDGQVSDQLSVAADTDLAGRRTGTNPASGPTAGFGQEGTPIPGLVPVPGQPAPLLPTYGENGMPGYPFYIAGEAGRRAPQAPLDIAEDLTPSPQRKYLDGGLPRHVVKAGVRKSDQPGYDGPTTIAEAVAIGDLTAAVASMDLQLLPYDGTQLEKRGMTFHHDGRGLNLRTAHGEDALQASATPKPVGYRSHMIGLDGGVGAVDSGRFIVNGAPPKPGAPFADPCGAPDGLAGVQLPDSVNQYHGARSVVWQGDDPLLASNNVFDPNKTFTADPALAGFRRFEVSAVQLDMTVNRAGWHDPQARINVLSAFSDVWKDKPRNDRISGAAQPFFFRAFSGECIEFRHTNELPHNLALDDFQMKVPTDTIGQHIHLVKFDVTSSDGSGNGFNYEDGTFAPGEIAERLCHSKPGHGSVLSAPDDPTVAVDMSNRDAICEDPEELENIWKEPRQSHREWFQTTVQRWFADPILSPTGSGPAGQYSTDAYAGPYADRTMRTVFSHDHFGPSNIQQHGFYSALLIEPDGKQACTYASPQIPQIAGAGIPPLSDRETCVEIARNPDGTPGLADANPAAANNSGKGVGALARVTDSAPGPDGAEVWKNPFHPDYREFALAIADFALLYDGHAPGADQINLSSSSAKGVVRLAGEAKGTILGEAEEDEEGAHSPASFVLDSRKSWLMARGDELASHARQLRSAHGRPVYPPDRPEAISQAHHDPYLVNYRTEPVPMRVGATSRDGGLPSLRPCGDLAGGGQTFNHEDVRFQSRSEPGDMANLFRSKMHGDPCTPVLDAIAGERVVVRLIQGAQEVQHLFTVEGRPFKRNVDQKYAYGANPKYAESGPTRWRACMDKGRQGWADKYDDWMDEPHFMEADPYWVRNAALLANCDNIDGYVSAQEVGISEHFEMSGPFARYAATGAESVPTLANAAMPSSMMPRDALFHFGTVDAVWSGAWGLFRIYGDSKKPDISACLAEAQSGGTEAALAACIELTGAAFNKPISDRLTSTRAQAESPNQTATVESRAPRDLVCPANSVKTYRVIAAVEARSVQTSPYSGVEGLIYNRKPDRNVLYDPDGLMFVPLELGDVRLVGKYGQLRPLEEKDILDRAPKPNENDPTLGRDKVHWPTLRNAMWAKVATRGATPLVVRMKANECMSLVFINALTEMNKSPDERPGLLDRPGDALMPKIVPLNVDEDSSDGGGSARDMSPSASLALSIPISVTSGADDSPSPFGVNPLGALPPMKPDGGGNGLRASWSSMTLYGGRMKLNEEMVSDTMEADPFTLPSLPGVTFNFRAIDAVGKCIHNSPPREPGYIYSVFGQPFCLLARDTATGAGIDIASLWATSLNAGLAAELETQVLESLESDPEDPTRPGAVEAIPYAYGALPIKSVGDIIAHGQHGLAGTLIVEPMSATLQPDDIFSANADIQIASVNVPGPDGTPTELLPAGLVQERSILMQDGLNLWDRLAKTFGDYGLRGRPLPSCEICDDSYDRGEAGVSYRSEPFFFRLRASQTPPIGPKKMDGVYADDSDLNLQSFPKEFFSGPLQTPELRFKTGGEAWIRVVAPMQRARQRAFVPTGMSYQDIFPGFGSGHTSLVGSGKALTAAVNTPEAAVCALWFDGPRTLFANGAWGRLCAETQ